MRGFDGLVGFGLGGLLLLLLMWMAGRFRSSLLLRWRDSSCWILADSLCRLDVVVWSIDSLVLEGDLVG